MREQFDLTIIGAGTAGVPCAIEAAAAGARVLLLERSDRIGGTLALSGAHLSAAGARRQRERGVLGDTPRKHFEDVVRITGDTARHDLLRLSVEQAPRTVDWLDDNGFEFTEASPFLMLGHEPYSVARTYAGVNGGHSVLQVYKRLLAPWVAGGRLDLRLSARVTELMSSRGRVTGVVYESAGGRTNVDSPHVILATGGYVGNHELFTQLHERPLTSVGMPTSTGDALALTAPLGIVPTNVDAFLPTLGGLPDPAIDGWAQWSMARPLLHAAFRLPWEIYVTSAGKRFIAEDHPSLTEKQRALHEIVDGTFFLVLDETALRSSSPIAGWDADAVVAAASRRRGVHAASSLAELARRAGIDAEGLKDTVRRYNASVARRSDLDYGRRFLPRPLVDAPYYAFEIRGIALDTFGGVAVDSNLQVISDAGAIQGLYAIGEALGATATTGKVICGGMLVTPAISFGRELGHRLAVAEVRNERERGAMAQS